PRGRVVELCAGRARPLRVGVPCHRPLRGRNLYLQRALLDAKSGARATHGEVRDDRGARRVPRGRPPRVKVLDYILDRVSRGKVHMTLIDPDKQSATEAGGLGAIACRAGTGALR